MYSPLRTDVIEPSDFKIEKRNYLGKCLSLVIIVLGIIAVTAFVPSDVKKFTEGTSILLIGSVCLLATFIHRLVVFFAELPHVNSRYGGSMVHALNACFEKWLHPITVTCMTIMVVWFLWWCSSSEWYSKLHTAVYCLAVAAILAGFEGMRSLSNVALNVILKENMTQIWAKGAYSSYYSVCMKDVESRIVQFEATHSVRLALKKFVLVIPLSCDVRGTFDERYPGIKYVGDLPHIVIDQGANMNRKYKNPVYEVIPEHGESFYLVMEQPSSILTILKMKDKLAKDILDYLRDSFIKETKEYFECHPGVVLVFDDTSPGQRQSLTSFLKTEVSRLQSLDPNIH